ncbi:type IV secretory system conjugative DNA transfer family protein [Frigoriglobus tundricola]|uniref:Conjugal transfer coupling protein TraG n=1 Tax=Frigoriglobus tundricola TaxID=2774151 RepID=A0A6M5YLG7_9BACT|nr:type IV secretory system conjugative DNA transfer family protein [Frigoriglobus tundricola]QJW94190.1 Conjugal transfer coupling protein TraG [Frigoriglobus tundricola]
MTRLLQLASCLTIGYSAALLCIIVPYLWVVPIVLTIALSSRRVVRLSSHGTARWADAYRDIKHLLWGSGIILGYVPGRIALREGFRALWNNEPGCCSTFLTSLRRKQPPRIVRLTDAVHVLCCAPTGAGKGQSIVLPHITTCIDSMVIIDPKKENWKFSAAMRERMNHKVIVLDPMGDGHSFNTLDLIDPESETAIDDIRAASEALIVKTGHEHDLHWNASAEVMISGLTAACVAYASKDDRNYQTVRSLLTNNEKRQAVVQLMQTSDKFGGILARLGAQIAQFEGKELASVLTSANRHLNFMDSPAIARCMKSSDFDPGDLNTGRMTIYCVVPPEYQRSLAPLQRLWLTSLLRVVVKGGELKRKVSFVCDEAASLGHLEIMDDAVDKYRSYGVRLLLIYQTLSQLQLCWPDGRDQTVLGNCTQVFFGINHLPTAEYIANRLGDFTQIVTNGGTNQSTSRQSGEKSGSVSHTSGSNQGWNQAGRKLLMASEIMQLNQRQAITFHPGVPPIMSWLVRFYEGFRTENGMGVFRVLMDTLSLLVLAIIVAAISTAMAIHGVK